MKNPPTTNYKLQTSLGFTLIEIVVATALFALVISSILGIYLSVLRLNTRTRAERAVADNARFITDFFSKEVRNGHIDYTAYNSSCGQGCIPSGGLDLYLVNQNNESEHIYVWDDTTGQQIASYSGVSVCSTDSCSLKITKTVGLTNLGPSSMNSQSVRVTNVQFLIYPPHDPYRSTGVAATENVQPHITLVLELTATQNSRDQVKLDTQSTYSELYYPSRQ